MHPGTQLLGATTVGRDCVIGPDTTLRDCAVGAGASVVRTQAELAEIGPAATVGPFSYLRPGTRLGDDGKIGGFVETKNAQIGAGRQGAAPLLRRRRDDRRGRQHRRGHDLRQLRRRRQAPHGSGGTASDRADNSVIVAPRDDRGRRLHRPPVRSIASDVPPGALAVARGRQRNVEGWVARRRAGTPAARGARRAQPTAALGRGRRRDRRAAATEQRTAPAPTEGAHG